MRYLLTFVFAALLGTFTLANPLPNPGFEDSGANWAIGDEISQIVPDAACTGKMGLRIGSDQYSGNGSSVTSSRFAVTPGQEITLSYQARGKVKTGAAYLLFYKADGKWGKTIMCQATNDDGAWHRYELKVSAPADAAQVAIWVHSFSSALGTMDVDDFAIDGLPKDAVAQAPPAPRKPKPTTVPTTMPARTKPAVIILKLDDIKPVKGNVHPAWQKVADYLDSRGIKCSMGVICSGMQEPAPAFAEWVRKRHESGKIEFWFHAWDHGVHEVDGEKYNEFNKRTYEDQKKRLDDSQKLAMDSLGFAFKTFGPPGGVGSASFDETTLRVMAEDPHITCMMYPKPFDEPGKKLDAAGKVVILDRVWAVNLEGAVGVPDSKRLIAGYAQNPDRDYFVLQGHPAAWSGERFNEFVRIIDFLVEQKAVFMTPSEYAATRKPARGESK